MRKRNQKPTLKNVMSDAISGVRFCVLRSSVAMFEITFSRLSMVVEPLYV